jgi:hypothetical protein
VKVSDMRVDSWFQILLAIERGERPSNAVLHRAFMRGEPLGAEQQRTLAKLFGRKRGAPKKSEASKAYAKEVTRFKDVSIYLLVREATDKLRQEGVADPQQKAFERVAKETRCGDAATVRRRYRRAEAWNK